MLLPAHWQTAAALLGLWWIGAEALLDASATADIALCTADRLGEADAAVAGTGGEVAVASLDPFGRPAPNLPLGVTDYATAVRLHADLIDPEQRPGPALAGASTDEVLAWSQNRAAAQALTSSDRVFSTNSWDSPDKLVDNLLSVLAVGASLVQVTDPDPGLQDRRRASEKVTKTLS